MCVSIANVVGLVVDYTICKKGEVVSPKVFKDKLAPFNNNNNNNFLKGVPTTFGNLTNV